jgi:putative ABC transport system substrate-binding protein
LVELGYREDQDFVLGVRFTQGDPAALPAAARQLVEYSVDLIFVDADESAKAAQQATTQIPIVFASVADPEGLGSIQSFARPGGNMTGVTDLELNLGPKRLQVFQELIPTLKRVLFPYDESDAYAAKMSRIYAEAARVLSIELIAKAVRTQEEARATLTGVRRGEIDGILMPFSNSLNIPGFIMETEMRQAIPAMYSALFELRARHVRNRQTGGASGGQDPQGCQAGRAAGRGEFEHRVCYQSEDRQSPGAHHSPGSVVSS